jgi:hypothetical protein
MIDGSLPHWSPGAGWVAKGQMNSILASLAQFAGNPGSCSSRGTRDLTEGSTLRHSWGRGREPGRGSRGGQVRRESSSVTVRCSQLRARKADYVAQLPRRMAVHCRMLHPGMPRPCAKAVLCVQLPARPEPPRLISDFCSSACGFGPRFLQTHLAVTPLRFASARHDLLVQRTFTSKSRAMLGAQPVPASRRGVKLSEILITRRSSQTRLLAARDALRWCDCVRAAHFAPKEPSVEPRQFLVCRIAGPPA